MMILMHDLEQPMQHAALTLANDEVLETMIEGASWETHLMELRHLEDGWLDGEGTATHPAVLMFAHQVMLFCHEHRVEIPAVFPSPDGNALLEWYTGQGVSSINLNLVEVEDGQTELQWSAYSYIEDPRQEIYREYSRDSAVDLTWFLTEVAPQRGLMPDGLPIGDEPA